jgi:hypothetical protein
MEEREKKERARQLILAAMEGMERVRQCSRSCG